MGEGNGKDYPHRKAMRARDESKTEEDGYYRAGQDGNNRNSRTGQMRRARRSSGGLTRRLELLGRRKLPGGARGIARRSRVGVREGRGKQQVGMKGQDIGMDMEDGRTSNIIAILGPRNWLGQFYMLYDNNSW